MSEDRKVLKEGTSIGRYSNINLITKSGMSIIYSAIDEISRKEVVLKQASSEYSSRYLEEEIRVLTKLNKKNIAGIVKCQIPILHLGAKYLPLEKLETPLLKDDLYTGSCYFDGRPFFVKLGNFIGFMADVLSDLERERIIHRDIKPENIMLDKNGEFKLLDFGLAYDFVDRSNDFYGREVSPQELYKPAIPSLILNKSLLRTETGKGRVLGTPGFIAPELICDSLLFPSTSSDIYSLGVTILDLLTEEYSIEHLVGIHPASEEQIKQMNGEMVERINGMDLPNGLEDLMKNCILIDPKIRPTPEELKEMNKEYMRRL